MKSFWGRTQEVLLVADLTQYIWAPILLSMGLGYFYGSLLGYPKTGIAIGFGLSFCILILILRSKL